MPKFRAGIGLLTFFVLTSTLSVLRAQSDSLALQKDSINISAEIDEETYNSPIDEIITYPAEDSTVYDIASQTVHMYGNAVVTYGDISLKADYIKYDFSRMEVEAFGMPDTAGIIQGKPEFAQDGQVIHSDTINYNFNSQKGLIKGVITNDAESYVHAEVSKKHTNGDIHNLGGKYTTCSNEKPHYHFRFNKMVVKPNDKIVTGPVYMKVGSVPLPLGLPFGFFPNSNKQQAGIVIPGYGNNQSLGYFLINGGYYLPIGEHLDTKLTGDIYSRGSWGLRNITRYLNRYKYSGSLDLRFNKRLNGDPDLANFSKTNSFFVQWNHTQDAKAKPSTSFSSTVNAGSSNTFRNNYNSSQVDYISNTFASSINFSKRWNSSQLTLSGRHSQNTTNRTVSVTLPQVGFNLNRFFLPLSFLRSSSTGAKKWYETIGVTYSSVFENTINTTEQEARFDNIGMLRKQIVNGIKHELGASTSLKAGYFNINPSMRMTERWHFAKQELKLLNDSTSYADTLNGFFTTRNYSFSTNVTTKLYGMFTFKGDGIKAIRHVLTPSLGFTYSPEFDYQDELEVNGIVETYNPFAVSAYTQTGLSQERGAITFGLQNNIEAKVKTAADSTGKSTKKIKLIENLNLRSSYNMMADSLNFSNLSVSANTTLYKNTTLLYTGSFDPYQVNETGQRINEYRWNGPGPILRPVNHRISLSTQLTGGNKSKKEEPKDAQFSGTDELEDLDNNNNRYVDFKTPWNLNLTYTFAKTNSYSFANDQLEDVSTIQQNVLFNGDIRIMERWKLGLSSGYDFEEKEITSAVVSFYWDLHCWEFNLNLIPYGDRQSYNMYIGVKAPILQDLKLQKRGNLGDGQGLFQ